VAHSVTPVWLRDCWPRRGISILSIFLFVLCLPFAAGLAPSPPYHLLVSRLGLVFWLFVFHGDINIHNKNITVNKKNIIMQSSLILNKLDRVKIDGMNTKNRLYCQM
jgi:hypothetical protein